jgi:hypothetical protein
MSEPIRAGAITFAIFSGVSFATAQGGPGSDHADLTPTRTARRRRLSVRRYSFECSIKIGRAGT